MSTAQVVPQIPSKKKKPLSLSEYLIGGSAAVTSGCFTNPLEVMKVRMQLQGELRAPGQHAIHYRNVFHAGYVIAKHDGILALQAGLVPALYFQFFLNGFRLGSYQLIANAGYLRNDKGELVFYRDVLAAGCCGAAGSFIASPIFLIKTHMQSRAAKEIAFGYQHENVGMFTALYRIFKKDGIVGLFRGASAALPRAFFGSSAQLSSFTYCKTQLAKYDYFTNKPFIHIFTASMIGGASTAMVMAPFDFVSTRLYNQGVDEKGRGLLYRHFFDCIVKIYRSEGILAFYKGLGACYFRIGPHTVLTLIIWDKYKEYYNNFVENK